MILVVGISHELLTVFNEKAWYRCRPIKGQRKGHVMDDSLARAVENGDELQVMEVLAKGADVRAADRYGGTPLHSAAWQGQKCVVEALADAGADVNARDKYRRTPLHKAAANGMKEAAAVLIANGANPNVQDNDDWTPLHWSVASGKKEVAMLLIANGGNPNAKTNNGWSVLSRLKEMKIKEMKTVDDFSRGTSP